MGSILLTILKIIGIVILIILGLILCILLLVLFVPVRYRGEGSYCDHKFVFGMRASWLMHMVSMRGTYQNEQPIHIYLKILGITIYDNQKAAVKKRKNKKKKSTKTKTGKINEVQAASTEDATISEEDDKDFDAGSDIDAWFEPEPTLDDILQDELTIFQKMKNFLYNFVKFFQNIKFTFHKVCDTIVKIKNNIKYYLKVLQLDSTKQAFATGKKRLGYVLKKISPRKYHIFLHLGFEDPAVMGEVLAVWGMLYPIHQGRIDIQPEFDRSVMEGNFSFRGYTNMFVFVQTAWVLFFDKDIKRLMKQLRRAEF